MRPVSILFCDLLDGALNLSGANLMKLLQV